MTSGSLLSASSTSFAVLPPASAAPPNNGTLLLAFTNTTLQNSGIFRGPCLNPLNFTIRQEDDTLIFDPLDDLFCGDEDAEQYFTRSGGLGADACGSQALRPSKAIMPLSLLHVQQQMTG